MTRTLIGSDAVTRLDEGHGSPADRTAAARFDLRCQADADRLLDDELCRERERFEAQQAEREDDE